MTDLHRMARLSLAGLACLSLSACCCGPGTNPALQQSLMQTRRLYLQNQQLAMQQDGVNQSIGALAAEKQQLEAQNQSLKANLDLANQRLDNLASSNSQLADKYKNLLTSSPNNPLSNDQIQRFEELRRKYPEFEFDPQTGVSKFSTDLLFHSGSDEITPRSMQILSEFAQIMNKSDAQHLKVLVVGHTDDKPIGKPNTRSHHPTNWHLSTNRADAVVLALRKSGMVETRMGSAGYSMYQPLTPNTSEEARQKNRRVEIFVLAPDAAIAGWDDLTPLK